MSRDGGYTKHKNTRGTSFSVTEALTNNKLEENIMTNRRVVDVQLIDDSRGLDAEDSLVAIYKSIMTEDSDEITIQQILMDKDVAGDLEEHNTYRSDVVNLDILERTGNSVNLRPVSLKDLRWVVKG